MTSLENKEYRQVEIHEEEKIYLIYLLEVVKNQKALKKVSLN